MSTNVLPTCLHCGASERIAALEAALAERDRVIEIAQEMAEYLRASSICPADTEAAEEVIRAIEEMQHAKP